MNKLNYNIERFFNWLNTNSKSNSESVVKTLLVVGMLFVPVLLVSYIN